MRGARYGTVLRVGPSGRVLVTIDATGKSLGFAPDRLTHA
jgi:hypothetical protein